MRKVAAAAIFCLVGVCGAEVTPPDYNWARLESVFPSGAARGQSIEVEFRLYDGGAEGGAAGILIDGPPGITVREIEATSKETIRAKLDIAEDAPLGRRMVRVHGSKAGLTNFRWFVVGDLGEAVETEKNNTPDAANAVETPLVVNGRIGGKLDQDCFRFAARKGQTIVAAINAHGLDAMGFGRDDRGFADLSLELLDDAGRTLASAGDTVGFDPIVEHEIPADGDYVVRVSMIGYHGFPQAVYRLTLGDVGYATAVFPSGGARGGELRAELAGFNLTTPKTAAFSLPKSPHPIFYAQPAGLPVHDLALHLSLGPEILETEPNNAKITATPLSIPGIANGRFLAENDEDWYRLSLAKNQKIELEIMAQRHLRSPIDTRLEIFDANGKSVAANDDGAIFGGETTHEFNAFDSYLPFAAKEAGDYFLRVTDETGASGPRTVYRLFSRESKPDFRAYHWPDAVPVWGPGSTASFAVEIIRLGGLKADVEFRVEGLPEGWSSAAGYSCLNDYRGPKAALGTKALITITAPPDAKIGDLADFQVLARAEAESGVIEHRAQALTLYQNSDPHQFQLSPAARAVVAAPQGPWLDTATTALDVKPGDKLTIPVTLHNLGEKPESFQIIANQARSHHIASFGAPVKVPAGVTKFDMPLEIPASMKPGVYGIVIARQWLSNLRGGLPGPCTPVIRLKAAPDDS